MSILAFQAEKKSILKRKVKLEEHSSKEDDEDTDMVSSDGTQNVFTVFNFSYGNSLITRSTKVIVIN